MNTPTIAVLDGHVLNPGDNPWDAVAAEGSLTVHPRTSRDQIIERSRQADIILTNKVPLDAATLDELPQLKYISVLATGYDVVDVAHAKHKGIPVSNVPGYAIPAVAQFVMAQVLEHCHRISDHDTDVKNGQWAAADDWCYWNSPQVELEGKTMGVVGFGGIGQRVAQLANAFGMGVLAYAPRPKQGPSYTPFSFVGLEELFERSDVVSLHCPLTSENQQFVNSSLLERMKPSALLVNTARGGLIDEPDLAQALENKTIAGAALDVVTTEPIAKDHRFLGLSNVTLTPHIAWASIAARQRLMRQTAQNIRQFLKGTPVNVVNS